MARDGLLGVLTVGLPVAQPVEAARDHNRITRFPGNGERLLGVLTSLAIVAGRPEQTQVQEGLPFALAITELLKVLPARFHQRHAPLAITSCIRNQPQRSERFRALDRWHVFA